MRAWHRAIATTSVPLLAVAGWVAGGSSAQAYTYNPCHWAVSQLDDITYTPLSGTYGTAVTNGAAAWNATYLGVKFVANTSNAEIALVANPYPNASWTGLTSLNCPTNGRFEAYSIVYLNRSKLDSATGNQRKQTVVHEFGHMLGLGHEDDYTSCSNIATMNSYANPVWACGKYTPQTDDVTGVYNLYY